MSDITRLAQWGGPKGFTYNYIVKPIFIGGSYRLLEPHYLNRGWYPAGSIINENIDVPIGWVPTLAVDPLNTTAVNNFYAAGPRNLSYEDLAPWAQMNPQDQVSGTAGTFIAQPVTFWVQSGGLYSLTGLGAGKPPVGVS